MPVSLRLRFQRLGKMLSPFVAIFVVFENASSSKFHCYVTVL